jgi:hypothetical protein
MHFISFPILQFHLFSTFPSAVENSKMLCNLIIFQKNSLRGKLMAQEMQEEPSLTRKT